MAYIQTIRFNDNTPSVLTNKKYGSNWPVVYIIDNTQEAYVGETLDASIRASQHLQNPDRRRLTEINIISNEDYNKSVILDLEAYLIKHMSVDGKFQLQNGNAGLHMHNYYNRAWYQSQFISIWNQLVEKNLATQNAQDIENSDLFKYSPYNALSSDQYAAAAEIIKLLAEAEGTDSGLTCVINGGPGTGKTVLAVYLMKLLEERRYGNQVLDSEDDEIASTITSNLSQLPQTMDIGFVVPMQSLRETLRTVFERTAGLNKDMVISPEDLTKHDTSYDLLVVDESHRLKRYKAIRDHKGFKIANKRIGLPETEGDELDWVLLRSKRQIFFYDEFQSVKPADIPAAKFNAIFTKPTAKRFDLQTQFRCRGGDAYVQYVRTVFSEEPPTPIKEFDGYDVKLFTDCGKMTDKILELDKIYGLCRTVAGFAWDWITRKKEHRNEYDIVINDRSYRWNTVATDWINHEGSVNEVGCIHTIQGYDLNYCAVIIGWEIDYDWKNLCFVVDKKKYKDNHGREVGSDMELLKRYIFNIYKTMLTRGICGTYIYACNEGLQRYLEQFFPTA